MPLWAEGFIELGDIQKLLPTWIALSSYDFNNFMYLLYWFVQRTITSHVLLFFICNNKFYSNHISNFILEPILDNCPIEKDASEEELQLDNSQGRLPEVSSLILGSTL